MFGGMNKNFTDRFFRKVDGMVWDMMSGKVGIQADDGILTLELDADNAEQSQISLNLFDQFGVALPAFAQSVPVDSVNVGDLIYSSASNKVMGWVIKKTEKQFRLMKKDGTITQWNPPKVQMLGFDSGVMVLRSLMNMLPGGSSGLGVLQSSLMPMMAMGMFGEDSEMSDMLPMMLMMQTGAGGMTTPDAANPMGGMMQTMMMMNMMKKMGGGFSQPKSNTSSSQRLSNKAVNSFFDH